jgi:hypothetical protein
MEELEKQSSVVEVATSGHGGLRSGSGRKPGSTQKLSGKDILEAIEQASNGMPYATILANDFLAARYEDDRHLVAKYHQLILGKVVADKIDITTNGQSIAPQLTFIAEELPEYIDVKPTPV